LTEERVDQRDGFPGTSQHQAVLRAVVSYYANDPRVLAVVVFGSLGRGNWDRYSDLDLDVVVADGIQMAVQQELTSLCDSLSLIGERAALIVSDGDEAGDVVLESLTEFSIRFHPLRTTSPNIVESLRVLAGRIDAETIKAAGTTNLHTRSLQHPDILLDACVRYAVGVDVALQRRQIWGAIELMHRMRTLLMELFARARNEARSYQAFEAQADPALQARLGATLPQYDLRSAQDSLARLLDMLENDLGLLCAGKVQLGESHLILLDKIRARQAQLRSADVGRTRNDER
jgi:predicted nucleotidyltransferase